MQNIASVSLLMQPYAIAEMSIRRHGYCPDIMSHRYRNVGFTHDLTATESLYEKIFAAWERFFMRKFGDLIFFY